MKLRDTEVVGAKKYRLDECENLLVLLLYTPQDGNTISNESKQNNNFTTYKSHRNHTLF